MTGPIFDRAHFDHMTGGDRALQAEVLALMRDQAGDFTAALGDDVVEPIWRAAVHKLKGSAQGIGLFRLADVCERAEDGRANLASVRAALSEALAAFGDDPPP